jgi:hypothetical protein
MDRIVVRARFVAIRVPHPGVTSRANAPSNC